MLSKGSRSLREGKEIPAPTNSVLEERRMDRKTGHVACGDFTVHHCDTGTCVSCAGKLGTLHLIERRQWEWRSLAAYPRLIEGLAAFPNPEKKEFP